MARIGIAHPQAREFHFIEAWVDTGASHSMLPTSLLEQTPNLSPEKDPLFELGDGREQRYGFGYALFKIEDDEAPSPVTFDPEAQYLLGATTLQNFNLVPDTNRHRLIPAPKLRI